MGNTSESRLSVYFRDLTSVVCAIEVHSQSLGLAPLALTPQCAFMRSGYHPAHLRGKRAHLLLDSGPTGVSQSSAHPCRICTKTRPAAPTRATSAPRLGFCAGTLTTYTERGQWGGALQRSCGAGPRRPVRAHRRCAGEKDGRCSACAAIGVRAASRLRARSVGPKGGRTSRSDGPPPPRRALHAARCDAMR